MNARATAKLGLVFLLTLVILLALLAVGVTISSREAYRQQAVDSIAQSYAGSQTFTGPVVAESYKQEIASSQIDSKGVTTVKRSSIDGTQIIDPKTLVVRGVLVPSLRHHGIYSVTVYELQATVDADFAAVEQASDRQYSAAQLQFAVTDTRGLPGLPVVTMDGQTLAISRTAAGNEKRAILTAVLPAGATTLSQPRHVHMEFVLGGTQQFAMVPVADTNHVQLTSAWKSPLFAGRFLPRTRSVDHNGFTAEWDIPSLATSAQQQIASGLTQDADTFDVTLIQPSDPYKLSDRATKYGVLFVLLTFAGFFIFEVMKQLPIHPVQYLLVGFTLALFFLLLISLSEHIAFGAAYLLSAAASIGLLTFYLSFVLRSVSRGLIFGAMQATLFSAIYGLLQSEDNALLLGSLLLFGVMAAVMTLTRKVDWYAATAKQQESDTVPATKSGDVAPTPWSR